MCPITVIISVKSGAHPVLHTVFHHFPHEIIHSPKQNFAEILYRSSLAVVENLRRKCKGEFVLSFSESVHPVHSQGSGH